MGKMSRDKGARGEREVIDLLQPIVDTAYREVGREPPKLKRTSSTQADGGGCDACGLPWLALECKWDESYRVDEWWKQCTGQAKPGQMPALIYKKNHRSWRVRCYIQPAIACDVLVADLAFDDFALYFAAMLRRYLYKT